MRVTEAVALSAGADHIWSMEAGVVIQTEPGEERSSLELVRRYLDELHERLGFLPVRATWSRRRMHTAPRRAPFSWSDTQRPLYLRSGYQEVPAYNDNIHADVWFEKSL